MTRAEPRPDGLSARLAAAGARGLVRFSQWRGRREAQRELRRGAPPSFRGLLQINLIRMS
jgi:hypothetical protein